MKLYQGKCFNIGVSVCYFLKTAKSNMFRDNHMKVTNRKISKYIWTY